MGVMLWYLSFLRLLPISFILLGTYRAAPDWDGGAVAWKGYKGFLPPGLHETTLAKDKIKRDYSNSVVYLLRSEVIMKF